MKTLKIIFTFLMASHFGAIAQNTIQTPQKNNNAAYKSVLSELLKVSGANANFELILEQMLPMLQQQNKAIPKEELEAVTSKFVQSSILELTELSVPIYQKHLDLKDLQEVIAFYKTPAGKKHAEKTPIIAQESMQISQQWAASLPYKFKQIANKVTE